jgi:c-di-GMP-related signal transduction protein
MQLQFSLIYAAERGDHAVRGVFGYELLYRGPQIAGADFGSLATARVICEALADLGIDRVVGDAELFIDFDERMLAQGTAVPPPPGSARC